MADFFDRLLAKSAPVARPADADGVKSAAAQPRLPHPFERPATAGDLEWTEQPASASEYSRRGNGMETRSDPTSGTRAAVPAVPRSDSHAFIPPRPDARTPTDSAPRPLLVVPAAEPPLPRWSPPALRLPTSQDPATRAVPPAPVGSAADTPILGSPADRIPATATPAPRQASALPAPAPQARRAERAAPPAHRAAAAPHPPSVTVRIGRLEVRAATPPPGPASRPERRTREPALKLEEYLAREGGRR